MFSSIATKKHLWKYYTKLPDCRAQCKFCENKYNYINSTEFKRHIAKKHKKIWEYERERKLSKWPWMYLKYLNKLYSQCIICDANVLSTSESAENHLSLHSEKQRENYIFCKWLWKYCVKRNDFAVECNIYHKYISLFIYNYLDFHIKSIHLDKLKNTREMHDTVGSSLSLERALSI